MITFLIWWAFLVTLGIGFMPLTGLLFHKFEDKGWIFSKVIGLAISGFFVWFLVRIHLLPFTMMTCTIVTAVCMVVNYVLIGRDEKRVTQLLQGIKANWRLMLLEELIFFLVFMMWTYLAGFHPAAYGTEKFMDYGFMTSMMRSTTLPAEDLWYSGNLMNYYYGGQYYAVFFTKLTGTMVEETYNVARTMVAGFAFILPFSLMHQLWIDHVNRVKPLMKRKGLIAVLVGLLSGAAVSMCGNMHYFIIGKLYPLAQKLFSLSQDDYSYWFPNSTRYIGHYPELSDRTIHEFPSYSFVLGDLHAHVVNIMYVLTVIGILYVWLRQDDRELGKVQGKEQGIMGWKPVRYIREYLSPYVWILGFFIGVFQWTNYWDFLIYFVVAGAIVFYRMIRRYPGKWFVIFTKGGIQWVTILVIGFVVALPFNTQFKSMVSGVALAKNHSIFYQWMILWGLPFLLGLFFIAGLLVAYKKVRDGKKKKHPKGKVMYSVFQHVNVYDMFVVILILCAMGLVVLTEIVYVRDIYEETSARSNTMFKLTYQAFMMFGMGMAYIIFRFLTHIKTRVQVVGIIGLACVMITLGYFGNAVNAWFLDYEEDRDYLGLDATQFLEETASFAQDAPAIRWLNENIEGTPVVLEVYGDSYSDAERVSAMTGLPTIVGWRTHEWLWRGDSEAVDVRRNDVKTIYTSTNQEEVKKLLAQYEVDYIFVGNQERIELEGVEGEETGDLINEELLRSLGEVVFESNGTYIVQVADQ